MQHSAARVLLANDGGHLGVALVGVLVFCLFSLAVFLIFLYIFDIQKIQIFPPKEKHQNTCESYARLFDCQG